MDNYKQLYEKVNEEYKGFYPLTDILSIIDKESGKNLKQLLNQYNHIKLDWKGNTVNTRNSVPLILRRKGLFVTYDNGASIVTEFYKGEDISVSINAIWQNDNNWTDLSPGASLADNEDIAEIDGKFKFANRNYSPAQFTGMGRIILRKNLADVGGGTVKNVLTQDMINKSNTIYEVRYDFDLGGKTLEVPANCVLEFKGGRFDTGTLVGNQTSIVAPLSVIFGNNLLLDGSFNADLVKARWFGVTGDGTGESTVIQKAIDFSANTNTTILFEPKIYHVDKPLLINKGSFTIDGNRCSFIKKSTTTTGIGTVESHVGDVDMELNTIFAIYGAPTRIFIKNCTLYGDESTNSVNGITIAKANNCTFENIIGWNLNCGFEVFNLWMSKLDMCRINNSAVGFKYNTLRTDGTKQGTGTSNVFTNCYANACNVGFLIDGIDYSTLNSCACDNCSLSYNIWQSSIVLNGCGSEGCDRLFNVSGNSCVTVNSMESYDTTDNANFNLITVAGSSKFTMVSSYIMNVQTYFIQAKDTASVLLYNNYITDGNIETEGRIRADETATISIIKNGAYYFYNQGESNVKTFLLADYLPAAYLKDGAIRKATTPTLMVYHQENVEASTISIPISKIQEYIPGFNNKDGYLNEPIKVDIYSRRFYTIGNIVNCHGSSTPRLSTDKAVYDTIQITNVSVSSGNLILTVNTPLIYYRVKISLP